MDNWIYFGYSRDNNYFSLIIPCEEIFKVFFLIVLDILTFHYLNRKYLRLESFIELHFQVLQAIKHIKCTILHIIFFTIVVWFVTIQFPFIMTLIAMVFIIASEGIKLKRLNWVLLQTLLLLLVGINQQKGLEVENL